MEAHAVPIPSDSVLAPLYAGGHNRLGRTYLAVIAPFHRAILRANLERTVRMLEGWIDQVTFAIGNNSSFADDLSSNPACAVRRGSLR